MPTLYQGQTIGYTFTKIAWKDSQLAERPMTQSNTRAVIELNLQEPLVLLMTTKHLRNLLVSLHWIQTMVRTSKGQSLLVVDESYHDIIKSITDTGKVVYYPRQQLKTTNLTKKASLLYHFYQQLRRHQASTITAALIH